MTPLQQAYLNKLRATADANAAFFGQNMPIHKILLNEGPSSTIDISDQGDLTIRYANGDSKPVTVDVLETEARLQRFADLDDRAQLLAFHKLRSVSEAPSHGAMQRYHYSNLDAEFPNRVTRHFAKHFPDDSGLIRYPDFGDKDIPLVIVFGSGLGWHLPRLILEYRIRHLIVIDTNINDFRLSVFFQDYVLTSRLAMEKGTDLTFIVQENVENVSRMLMSVLLRTDGVPAFFIHGAALFYAVKESEEIASIRKTITDTLWELFFGLGYFDDELITIKHTFDNLQQGFPIYMKPGNVSKDAIAFIVGSGPSLDDLLPILREYGDRAVIFSCGTALSALAKAGIRPDFHVEKERPYIIYEVITKTVYPEFLKGIHFLGTNVVHADVFRLFDSSGMIMKSADTMTMLLKQFGMPENVLLNLETTVTNTAIDLAISAGFKQIYLFGVDMGYKDKNKRHSPNTVYHNSMPEEDHLQRLLKPAPVSDIIVPGNFSGDVHTNKVLSFARRLMGESVTRHAEVSVYNMNDGAMIEGTIPLQHKDFVFNPAAADKLAAVETVKIAFEQKQFDLTALKASLLQQIDDFIADVSAVIRQEQNARSDVIDKLIKLNGLSMSPTQAATPCALLFRGTMSRLLSMLFNALTIIKDDDEALAKAEWDFSNILDCLRTARAEVAKIIPNNPS